MSSTLALCVSQPTAIWSTPVAAISAAVSGVMRPGLRDRPAARHRHGAAQIIQAHVVQQDHVHAQRQRGLQLLQRVDLQLDPDHVADARPRPRHRIGDAAREGDVVVLDQHRVVQAEAMIAAAAHAHGVFLQGAQARHGLARAGHARAIRRHGPRDRCGGGGDAAQVAQEVQRHALGRQHGAGAALDARDLRARLQHAAVRARHAEADRRIQRAERQPRQVQPGQHALLARHQARFRLGVGGHDGIRRQVSRATQVLEQRGAHHRLQHYVRQRRNGQAVGRCEGFSIYAHNEYF